MRFKSKKDFVPTSAYPASRNEAGEYYGRKSSSLRRRESKSKAWGFTLMEVLIVLAIMAIMTGILLARRNLQSDSQTLEQATQRLISELRRAQGMAVAGAQDLGGLTKATGYGIKDATTNSYVLFVRDSIDANFCPAGNEATLVTILLPANITIANSFGVSPANVFFSPPDPKTCINDNSANGSIVYTLTLAGICKKVNITKYGQIGEVSCP